MTSERFMKFYVVTSFLLIVALTVMVVVLFQRQQIIIDNTAHDHGVSDVDNKVESLKGQTENLSERLSEVQDTVDAVYQRVD